MPRPFGNDEEPVSVEIESTLGANTLMQAAQRHIVTFGAEVRNLPGHKPEVIDDSADIVEGEHGVFFTDVSQVEPCRREHFSC